MLPFRRSLRCALSGGGAAAFSPTSIAGLKLWLDASQIVGLNDGDAVATWSDLSGNALGVTQSIASRRPTYQTNEINSLPAVQFDGSDDFLANLVGTLTEKNGCTILAVFKANVANANNCLITKGPNDVAFLQWPTTGLGLAKSGVAWMVNEGTIGSSAWQIASATYDGSTAKVFRANIELNSAAYSSALLADNTGFVMGLDGASYFSGYLAELIVYNREVTGGERTQLQAYAAAKYGL